MNSSSHESSLIWLQGRDTYVACMLGSCGHLVFRWSTNLTQQVGFSKMRSRTEQELCSNSVPPLPGEILFQFRPIKCVPPLFRCSALSSPKIEISGPSGKISSLKSKSLHKLVRSCVLHAYTSFSTPSSLPTCQPRADSAYSGSFGDLQKKAFQKEYWSLEWPGRSRPKLQAWGKSVRL